MSAELTETSKLSKNNPKSVDRTNQCSSIVNCTNRTEGDIMEESDIQDCKATVYYETPKAEPSTHNITSALYASLAKRDPLPANSCLLTSSKDTVDSIKPSQQDMSKIDSDPLIEDSKCENFLTSTPRIADLESSPFLTGEDSRLSVSQHNRLIEEMSDTIAQLTKKINILNTQLETKQTENQDISEHNNDLIEQLTSLHERATLAEVKISELESDLTEERENNEKLSAYKFRALKLEEKLGRLEQEHEYELHEGSLLRKNEFEYKRRERNMERWIDILSRDYDIFKENSELNKNIYDEDTLDENSETTLGSYASTAIPSRYNENDIMVFNKDNNSLRNGIPRDRVYSQSSSVPTENNILVKELNATKDRLRQLEMILLSENSIKQSDKLRQAKSLYTLHSSSKNSFFKDYALDNKESQRDHNISTEKLNDYQDRRTPTLTTSISNCQINQLNNSIHLKRSLPNLTFSRFDDQSPNALEGTSHEIYSPPYTTAPVTPILIDDYAMEITSGGHSEDEIQVSKRRNSMIYGGKANQRKGFEENEGNNVGHIPLKDNNIGDYFTSQQTIRKNDDFISGGNHVNSIISAVEYKAHDPLLKPRIYRSTSYESIMSNFSTINKPCRAPTYSPASHLAVAYALPIATTSSLTASSSTMGTTSKTHTMTGNNSKTENGSASRYLSSKFRLNTATTAIGNDHLTSANFDARHKTSKNDVNNSQNLMPERKNHLDNCNVISAQRAISMPIMESNNNNGLTMEDSPSTTAPNLYRWKSILSKFSLTKASPLADESSTVPRVTTAIITDGLGSTGQVTHKVDNGHDQVPSTYKRPNTGISPSVNLLKSASTSTRWHSPTDVNGNGVYPRPKLNHRRVLSSKVSHAALREALGEEQ
ncbi:hypothetical protein NADFUDRAFT_39974 [Nadsonia fulvescens var. elongata DSM 6958]|uniref:Uncharacterized protein n=1 Tax=Nadsonia fulvescens var. elongata DSM 6958 TaxID=857566 RepID=A0A1E3PUG9_9ASCO|nr:hypothetical protein NADFUDRAFT_39974 [Nadsonia fulvescens var. elongata DSM 6958]